MLQSSGHLVIVEDDLLLRISLRNFFIEHQFKVADFEDSTGVIAYIEQQYRTQEPVDIILCDIMMPNSCGYSLIKSLKEFEGLGKIFISAKGKTQERIKGLSLGVDDYICKPIDSTELLLRTQTLIKRLQQNSLKIQQHEHCTNTDFISFLHFTLHPETRVLTSFEGSVELGTSEFKALLMLVSRHGKICSREQLSESISQDKTYLEGRALDILMSRLRKKLNQVSNNVQYITTIRSRGYLLNTIVN